MGRRSEEIQSEVEEMLETIAEHRLADNVSFLEGLIEGIKLQVRDLKGEDLTSDEEDADDGEPSDEDDDG